MTGRRAVCHIPKDPPIEINILVGAYPGFRTSPNARSMFTEANMEGLWHKNTIVYTIDVPSFADGNGDGIGDFLGLSRKLDYLAGLNVKCIWLQPFFLSPYRDHGYDVSDYYSIDPRYGTLGDFVEFSQAASERGIRIIADLVVNHTSIDHPGLTPAGTRTGGRNWYVWSKDKPPMQSKGWCFGAKTT